MTGRYDDVLGPLRAAYDERAAWRDALSKEPWKQAERESFRDCLPCWPADEAPGSPSRR